MNQLKTVLPYFRPYRGKMVWGLILVVFANAFALAGPYLLKLAIDALGEPGVTRRILGRYALLMVAAAVVGGAARYGMRELLNGVSRRIEVDLRNDFLGHLLKLDAGFYNHTRTGDLMSRATNDTMAVRQAVGPAVMYSANTAVNFVIGVALMVWISPQLTLVSLIPMALLPPIVVGFGRLIHRRFERIQEQFSTLSNMVQENLSGVRIVRAYQQERSQAQDFDLLNQEYLERNMALAYVSGAFHPILGLFSGAAMIAVLWFGGLQVMAGTISIGDFVAFSFYLALLTWPMIALGWVVNLLQRGAASMGRINTILETEPLIVGPAVATPPSGDTEITFDNVTFKYPGTERLVLSDISFVAKAGQTVAVVGPTGSGKSTLVSLISRIYDPTSGTVLLGGIPLPRYDPADVRSLVGFVPQDTFLFSATLAENIALGVPSSVDEVPRQARVERASLAAQLHSTVQDFPNEYKTVLGERGINLSGGQKQRATLARALAMNPPVLVLDDALSAVDTHTEAQILADLRNELEDRTAFIISHRVTAVMDADLILVLDEGRIVERGTHRELLALGGTYASLLRRQLLEQDISSATA